VVKTGQSLSRHSLNLPVRLKAQLSVDKATVLSRSKALTAEIEVVRRITEKVAVAVLWSEVGNVADTSGGEKINLKMCYLDVMHIVKYPLIDISRIAFAEA